MKHTMSLKENHLFRRAYNRGKTAADSRLALYIRRNGGKTNRLGLTVSTKVGCAVVRNRVRRRLREIYRLSEGRLAAGFDVVIVARVRAASSGYRQLEQSFLRLADKLGLLKGGRQGMKRLLLALIRWYRRDISPCRPPCCRFIPTCSAYALEAVEVHGAFKGGALAVWRVLRCHPFHKEKTFIYDPVPKRKR